MKKDRRKSREQPGTYNDRRHKVILTFLGLVFLGVSIRASLIHLSPNRQTNLTKIAKRQYEKNLKLSTYRGHIYDRRGNTLAISIQKKSIFVNPKIFNPSSSEVRKISKILGLKPQKVQAIAGKNKYFSWLKRKVSNHLYDEILKLNLKGVSVVNEPGRFYPAGYDAGQVIGAVGVDNNGIFGVEKKYDKDLRGQSIDVKIARDAKGRMIILKPTTALPEKTGHNIHLTIDQAIQNITENALRRGVKEASAKAGFAIVSDPYSGHILAVANYPSFNPNSDSLSHFNKIRNRAFYDRFEPGSIIKPFTIATAMQHNKTKRFDVHNCENGRYRAGGVLFRDDHPDDYLTTEMTLVRSSNICTFKIAEKIGKKKLFEGLNLFGFGKNPENIVQIAPDGNMSDYTSWKAIRFANIAFGQGLPVNGVEMVAAMNSIANGGLKSFPSIVSKVSNSDGLTVFEQPFSSPQRIMTEKNAREMREMLGQVVDNKRGSGSRAKLSHWTSGGKTGTAEKYDPVVKGYHPNKRIASWLGFAPVKQPHLVVYVMIDEPGKKPYYGGLWAAPIFRDIMESSLGYLNIKPDKSSIDKKLAKNKKSTKHG